MATDGRVRLRRFFCEEWGLDQHPGPSRRPRASSSPTSAASWSGGAGGGVVTHLIVPPAARSPGAQPAPGRRPGIPRQRLWDEMEYVLSDMNCAVCHLLQVPTLASKPPIVLTVPFILVRKER